MSTQLASAAEHFTTRKLHPSFVLEITGLDVSKPLDGATIEKIKELSAQYKLLVFKNQTLSDAWLDAFAQQFGDTNQIPPTTPHKANRSHNVTQLSARGEKGELSGYGLVARFWHTDSSWRPVPTWLSFLSAVTLPDSGGDTCFADMEAAYEALSEERKSFLQKKQMIHNWITLRRYEPSIPPMGDDVPPPATHPVVRTVNGRKSLFLNGHNAYYIGNMPFEEGVALFNELMEHATSAPFVYQHKWSLGDLLMWDNRTTMHRVMPYDLSQVRVMRRAEVKGTEVPQ